MKKKNRVMAISGISVLLCLAFLVAIPVTAIAAEQDDFVLGVYGNANEDDTIDMRDLTYVKLIFFGKKPETELADAKYDGKINPLDFIQIKLIIVGKEKEITIEIPAYPFQPAQIVTVHKPVERLVILMQPDAEVLRALNVADKIFGVGSNIRDDQVFFPKLSKLPSVGSSHRVLDYEAILNLRPDLLVAYRRDPKWLDEEKLPGVKVIGMGLTSPRGFTERVRQLGYILDKEEEAEEYINWHEGWVNKIKSRAEGLSEDEKPRVFIWEHFQLGGGYQTITKQRHRKHDSCVIVGGINIGADLKGDMPAVDPEWVIEQNPDIIVTYTHPAFRPMPSGYGTDDPSEMAAVREDILNRPELANVNAVKNGRVYILGPLSNGGRFLICAAYQAKWFHPDLFEDLDPQAIHQEYLTEFQGLDYDLNEHGVFVYPPLVS